MEKLRQKLAAMWGILMDRGVLYNVKVERQGDVTNYGAVRGNHIVVAGYSRL